jgi:transmembrane sensor
VRIRLPKTKGMLRREAADWLARLHSDRDPDAERKFRRWYDGDSRNAAAFERVQRSYQQAGLLSHSPAGASGLDRPRAQTPQWKPRPALAAAAVIVLLVPVGFALLRDGGQPFAGTDAVMLMTRVGEIKQVNLADGSRLTLDTATEVEVTIGRSRRGAYLRYGRARFQVAGGSEPFVVNTHGSIVSTRRGIIDVEQIGQQSAVKVLAGAADVRTSEQRTSTVSLRAGESVTVDSTGTEQKSRAAPTPDWTRGMLQFDGTLLGDAAALANRYSNRHIVLLGDVDSLQVTGAFRAGDTEGLARALGAAFNLSIQQRPDGDLVLSRQRSQPKNKNWG